MKKNAFEIILAFGIMLLFANCKKHVGEKKEGEYIGQFSLTADELSYFPYSVNDTLIFRSSLGDTRKIWVSSVDKQLQTGYEDPTNYNSNYFHTENLRIEFSDNLGKLQKIYMRTQVRKERTQIETFFSPPSLTGNDSAYKYIYSYMDGYKFSTSTDTYHPAIIILNKQFYTVFEIVDNFDPYIKVDNLKNILFAKNIGIVGFKTKNNVTWVLDN